MDSNKNLVNSIPGLGTGFKIGSGVTGAIIGLAMIFLVLYLITIDPEQKQMWLILMILMMIVAVIATIALASRRKSSRKSTHTTHKTTTTKVVEKQVVVKHCVKCGETIPEKAQYCEKCGEKQPSSRTKKLKKCEKCDKDIAQSAVYCEYCGAKQSS